MKILALVFGAIVLFSVFQMWRTVIIIRLSKMLPERREIATFRIRTFFQIYGIAFFMLMALGFAYYHSISKILTILWLKKLLGIRLIDIVAPIAGILVWHSIGYAIDSYIKRHPKGKYISAEARPDQ